MIVRGRVVLTSHRFHILVLKILELALQLSCCLTQAQHVYPKGVVNNSDVDVLDGDFDVVWDFGAEFLVRKCNRIGYFLVLAKLHVKDNDTWYLRIE